MCKEMHKYLLSARFKSKCKKAFDVDTLLPVQNCICTKLCFSMLEKIVTTQRESLDEYISEDVSQVIEDMDSTERSILRYICGAAIP